MSKSLYLSAALALGVVACAPNREDYEHQKTLGDFAKLQVANGDYTGLLHSVKKNKLVGALSVHLEAKTKARNPGSGDSSSSALNEAVLEAHFTYVGKQVVGIGIDNSYFDPDEKNFQANLSVLRHNGHTEQLSFGGHIDNGHFDGTVSVVGYEQDASSFALKKDGPAPESLLPPELQPTGDDANFSEVFKGSSTFKKTGVVVPVDFVVVQPSYSPDENFLNIFIPIKTVQVTLNYSDSLQILHDNATWDQRAGSIIGSSAIGNNKVLNLNCRSKKDPSDKLLWKCSHNGNDSGLVANTQTYTDEDFATNHKRDDIPGSVAAITTRFYGTAEFGHGNTTNARLESLYPAQSRDQLIVEQFFPVKTKHLTTTLFLFKDPEPISIGFDPEKTIWDQSSGTLNGVREERIPGYLNVYNISCTGFYMEKTTQPFTCDYSNNLGPNNFHITFEP